MRRSTLPGATAAAAAETLVNVAHATPATAAALVAHGGLRPVLEVALAPAGGRPALASRALDVLAALLQRQAPPPGDADAPRPVAASLPGEALDLVCACAGGDSGDGSGSGGNHGTLCVRRAALFFEMMGGPR